MTWHDMFPLTHQGPFGKKEGGNDFRELTVPLNAEAAEVGIPLQVRERREGNYVPPHPLRPQMHGAVGMT